MRVGERAVEGEVLGDGDHDGVLRAGLRGEGKDDVAQVAVDFPLVGGEEVQLLGAGEGLARGEEVDCYGPVAAYGHAVGFVEARGAREDDVVRVHFNAEAVAGVQHEVGFMVDLAGAAEELPLQVGAAAAGGCAAPAIRVNEEVAVDLVSDLGGEVEEAKFWIRGWGARWGVST